MRICFFTGMRYSLTALFVLTLLSWSIPVPGEDWSPKEIEATFRNKCNHCHTVPDPGRSFDRAWLDQVKRTA